MRAALRAAFCCALLALVVSCGHGATRSERDAAIRDANVAYAAARATGADLRAGPCIAERLTGEPDWSVDIAHQPRQAIDDQAANQCQAFRRGTTHHFVELDPDGQLIRAK